MTSGCCCCASTGGPIGSGVKSGLPLICLVPRGETKTEFKSFRGGGESKPPQSVSSASGNGESFKFLDEKYLKKHFNFPERALYLDPFRRPLITYPKSGENTKNFTLDRKKKINQQILDGFLDPSEAISAPSVFPYAPSQSETEKKKAESEEEIIYILQLPDWEFKCPTHNQTIRTPRFIWHSCKKDTTAGKEKGGEETKQGRGPMFKPKPWILARHIDFDLMSQW